MPDPPQDDQESDVDRAFAEFLRRNDAGEAVDRALFLGEHTTVSGELSELLETARLVEQMAGPSAAETDETDAPDASETAATIELTEQTQTYVSRGRERREFTSSGPVDSSARQFGEYQLLEELGRGGMGVVYKATQTNLNRLVAVKMILSGHWASRNQIDRFYIEAKAAGKLSHPNIVKVYQVGEVEGQHFFSMEFVEGQSLSQVLRGGALSPERAARYLRQIADAAHFAHENQILHRDLKPSNILIDAEDQPRITDFGLARDVEDEERLTVTGAALGTPSYMSPEQALAKHEEVGRRSDIYSLGAMLYEMLTGQPPFHGDSIVDTILNVIHTEPAPPSSVDKACDRDLEAICLKCLHKNPDHRYASANELADDLDRFLRGNHILARRARWHRRVLHWLRDVPIVSAIVGRKMNNPTVWHKRLQATVLIVPLVVVIGLLAKSWIDDAIQYGRIDVATGEEGLSYHQLAADLVEPIQRLTNRPVELHPHIGSVASRQSLQNSQDDLAVIQENAIKNGSSIQVLAPLYYETILIIVRKDSGINTIADLAGQAIALGGEGSGMRLSAERVLDGHELSSDSLRRTDSNWTELAKDKELAGTIVTIKLDNERLQRLLETSEFKLVAIPDAEEIVPLRATTIDRSEVPAAVDLPERGIQTAQTMAVLAVRNDAPDWFVTACLEGLYRESTITTSYEYVFSLQQAAELKNSNLHRAARRFFENARGE